MKRYRYITCGQVSPDEPVANFRLLATNKVSKQSSAIRIAIPENVKLTKFTCDEYSTWEQDETTLLRELDPVLVVRINRKLTPMYGIWPEIQPHAVHHHLIMAGYQYDFRHGRGYIAPKK